MNVCTIFSLNRSNEVVKFMLENDNEIMCVCSLCNFARNICIMTCYTTIDSVKKCWKKKVKKIKFYFVFM